MIKATLGALAVLSSVSVAAPAAPDKEAAAALDALRAQAGRVVVMNAKCVEDPYYAARLPSPILVGAAHVAIDEDVEYHRVDELVRRGTPEGLRLTELPLATMLSQARYAAYASGKALETASGKGSGFKDEPVRPQVRRIIEGTRPAYPDDRVETYFGPVRDLKEGRIRVDDAAGNDELGACWKQYQSEAAALDAAIDNARKVFLARARTLEDERRAGYSGDTAHAVADGATDAAALR